MEVIAGKQLRRQSPTCCLRDLVNKIAGGDSKILNRVAGKIIGTPLDDEYNCSIFGRMHLMEVTYWETMPKRLSPPSATAACLYL